MVTSIKSQNNSWPTDESASSLTIAFSEDFRDYRGVGWGRGGDIGSGGGGA